MQAGTVFKTPILRESLRTQNLHQVEHCAFSDVVRLFQSVGCVRNKLQLRTVQQNQKASLRWSDRILEIKKIIFGTNLRTLSIVLMTCGKVRWQEVEATRKDFNIVLIRQDKKFFISELFKVIQDAIPLIRSCTPGQCVNSGQFLRLQ